MDLSLSKIIFIIIIIYILWMDTCLYSQIKFIYGKNQTTTTTKNVQYFSSYAFNGMSVKLMMMDPIDNYFLSPLAEIFVEKLNLKNNYLFITPNLISYLGVLIALIAAKLISICNYEKNNYNLQLFSYLMFQLRTWLDDLDGSIARSRLGINQYVSLKNTSGYVIDGICDGIGFIAYIIGCYIFIKNDNKDNDRRLSLKTKYNLRSIITKVKSIQIKKSSSKDDETLLKESPLIIKNVDDYDEEELYFAKEEISNLNYNNNSKVEYKNSKSGIVFYYYIKDKIKIVKNENQLIFIISCFLLQLALSATFWNRYILIYRDLLEISEFDSNLKRKILSSNYMFIIIWFWRLTNGHSLMQMLITSVLFKKGLKFLSFVKCIFFIEILVLVLLTELHILDIKSFLLFD